MGNRFAAGRAQTLRGFDECSGRCSTVGEADAVVLRDQSSRHVFLPLATVLRLQRQSFVSGGTPGKEIVTGDTVISVGDGELTASLRTDRGVIDQRDERVLPEWVGLNGRDGSGETGRIELKLFQGYVAFPREDSMSVC